MMQDIPTLINAMAEQLSMEMERRGITYPALLGIHTGGVWVAQQLQTLLGISDPLGSLDIAFYRDDFSRIGLQPQVKPSELPFDVDGRHIILVDDV
ncbi:MAG: bifunctional pyr operon transcriptional regulator/uracil phosphoribosyltransferase, partial [Gammaproteobacteria bacterium]|nr:bifunctional pyr operon transcriptional regulator/uracil phosphoribosyltransferase [Gammaproteobacteria bacterium]